MAHVIRDTPTQAWVARYGEPGDFLHSARALAVDGAGNVYVTGSKGYVRFFFRSINYVTIKYDSEGNELWVARYGEPGDSLYHSARALAVDGAGNVYVTGWSKSDSTGEDYATIKYDSEGNELWVARYNGPDNSWDSASALAVDGAGNVYVTGLSDSDSTGEDYATIKYDSEGNELWVARYDGSPSIINWTCRDSPSALAVDGAGNVYVTGESDILCIERLTLDYATIKYDSEGNELWVARYDGIGDDDRPSALAIDGAGNVYVTGGSYSVVNESDVDYATIKYDSEGNELWVARYNGSASALAVDGAGNVYVTGTNAGDYATIKYDSEGNELWVASYISANRLSFASALVLDGAGNVYVTGESDGDYATIKYVQQPSSAELRPEVRANGATESVTIAQGTPVRISVALNPGTQGGQDADWWVAGFTPFGIYWFTVDQGWVLSNEQAISAISTPLVNLAPTEVLNVASLPAGEYTFAMGVDMKANGRLDVDSLYYDLVIVTI